MSATTIDTAAPAGGAGQALTAVRTEGLVKTFGDLRAVDGIDIEVTAGQVFAVLGPNGAGKTTMLKMLATLLPIDGGHAEVFGVDVRKKPHVIRQLVGVTGQYASVDENLTATENLWLFGKLQGLSSVSSKATAADLLGRCAGRDEPAVVEQSHGVGEVIGLLEVLRREQDRDALGEQLADDVPQLTTAARVEAGGRLVEEDDPRPADQGHGEVETALHAPGVRRGAAVGGLGEAEPLQQLVHPGRPLP